MATHLQKHVTGIPVISSAGMNENTINWIVATQNGGYLQSDHFHYQLADMPNRFKQSKCLTKSAGRADSTLKRMNGLGRKSDVLASVREHVRLSPKITEAVKGKLSLGARILQVGGMEKVFRLLFGVSKKERLIKASQCYLSTTAGPIAGLLFISTERVAFCSERSIKLRCPTGEAVRIKYKVAIPLSKIETANQSENMKRPSQKYIQIITVDGFEFWFMGFLNHHKSFKCLQDVISQVKMVDRATEDYMEKTPQVVEIAKRIL